MWCLAPIGLLYSGGRKDQVIKRLAVLLAAEEAVAAYHEMLEHPSAEADLHFRGCFALLTMRLAIWQRDELAGGDPIPQPMQAPIGAPWAEALLDLGDRGPGILTAP